MDGDDVNVYRVYVSACLSRFVCIFTTVANVTLAAAYLINFQ